MTSKDQTIGGLICTVCVIIASVYTVALFWPALEAIRIWLVAIPVFIAFIAILGIGAWIGWTMATTPAPMPIEEIQTEKERVDFTTRVQHPNFQHNHPCTSQQPACTRAKHSYANAYPNIHTHLTSRKQMRIDWPVLPTP